MIIPTIIHGHTINFCVSPALASRDAEVRVQIGHLVAGLNRIPLRHLKLLKQVPIVIYQAPRGPDGSPIGRGGWVSPTAGRQGEATRNPLYDAWLTGRRGRRFGVQEELVTLPHSNGIIHMTDAALFRTAGACQLTILHETGHCVDHHLDLNSVPIDGGVAYRNGNRPYQGQRYPGRGYTNHEFKAETYSRLFIVPGRICRQTRANPACENSAGHSRCNQRLRQDLANSAAFRVVGQDVLGLPTHASAPGEGTGQLASARGPAGLDAPADPVKSRMCSHRADRVPGPDGMA